MYQVLGHDRASAIEHAGCLHNGLMNMTYIALRFSRYVNGVAMQHGKVSQQMFPDYKVHSITNGVHAATWLSPPFQELLDAEIPDWRTDNQYFRSVYGIDPAPHRRLSRQRQAAPLRRRRQTHRPPLQPLRPHPRLRPPRRHLQARQPPPRRSRPSGRHRRKDRRSPDSLRRQGPSRRQRRQGPHPRRLRRRGPSQLQRAQDLLPRKLRLGARRSPHPGRRRLGQHPAPPL